MTFEPCALAKSTRFRAALRAVSSSAWVNLTQRLRLERTPFVGQGRKGRMPGLPTVEVLTRDAHREVLPRPLRSVPDLETPKGAQGFAHDCAQPLIDRDRKALDRALRVVRVPLLGRVDADRGETLAYSRKE